MVVAAVVTVAWEQSGQPFEINAILVSLPATLLTLVAVSLLVPDRRTRPDRADPQVAS